MQGKHWHETAVDTTLFLQLQDLTTILSKRDDLQFDYSFGSFIHPEEKRLTASTFWETTPKQIREAGYKTDVYLRAIGTLHHSSGDAFRDYFAQINDATIPSFAEQLITLFEDIRLEEIIKQARPGTSEDFAIRRKHFIHYFQSQLTFAATRQFHLDELFCMIYLQIVATSPDITFPRANKAQVHQFEQIKPTLFELFEATTTEEVATITMKVVWQLASTYTDMTNTYFPFPVFNWDETWKENSLFDELTRTDDLANEDSEQLHADEKEYEDETFSTWHRENKNTERKETFLQMNLDVGTKTNLTGGTARETESGDQAFATAQGMSQQHAQNDYSKMETIEKHTNDTATTKQAAPYGIDNIRAVAKEIYAERPSDEDNAQYEAYVAHIEPYKRHLAKTIELMIERKRNEPRSHLHVGRLSKNLLPIVTEENPRLFYKKDNEATEFDALFTLMVDCSASMHTKMTDTKRSIALFHEVLKQLTIPHAIIGFWEGVTTTNDEDLPNYFHIIHDFDDSLYDNNGAKIMQLEAKEDNRDGFSIRIVTEKILKRSEQHKFLLVFSDGEPAAADYEQNGIVDTHVAVTEARKQGIDTIGIYLADGKVSEYEDDMMQNIYGNERLMISDLEQLPEQFTAILKKLLMKVV